MQEIIVLIATSGRGHNIIKTLNEINRSNKDQVKFQIVIVENGEKSDLQENVSAIDNVRYLYSPKSGKSNALNFALAKIEGNPLVLMTDDDIGICENWISKYISVSKQNGPNCYFGGSLKVDYNDFEPNVSLLPLMPESVRGTTDEDYKNPEKLFLGANWAAYKSDIISAGGFDPAFGPGGTSGATGQETQMQIALKKNGLRACLVKDAYVIHTVESNQFTFDWLEKRISRDAKSKMFRMGPYMMCVIRNIYPIVKPFVNILINKLGPSRFKYKLILLRELYLHLMEKKNA
jgi:GT2 family glycosyltransferase